jgi:hypothetical protein
MSNKFLFCALLCIASTLLVACGDAGDHFGEFRRTNSKIVPVVGVIMSVPTFKGQSGTYPIAITALQGPNNPIPYGQQYKNPILLTSSGPCAGMFGSSASGGSNATFTTFSIPNTTTPVYVSLACSPSTITASNKDMTNPVTIQL